MPARLSAADRRLLWICLLIAALSVAFGALMYPSAFPEAAIEFAVTRESSRDPALHFLAERGVTVTDYRHAAIFAYDDLTKVFLERELGLGRATALLRERVRLWRWQHRWFKPLQKEEAQVAVATTGEVVGFMHELPEDRPGAQLERAQAQALAERFLFEVMKRPRDQVAFVEANAVRRQARVDHAFTWKDRRVTVSDATYRYKVEVMGDEIGGYHEYLQIPEQWRRDYEKLRSLNEVTGTVAAVLMGLTAAALLVSLVLATRSGTVAWGTAAALGGAAFVIGFLAHLNNFPMAHYAYQTTESYSSFLLRQLVSALIVAGSGGAAVLLLAAGAEPQYRERYRDKLALGSFFRWRGLRTREFLIANVVGLTMTCFFFAYETVFYTAARWLGAWAPADVPYDNLLSTAIPWAFVVLFGFFPATTEEFLSRMFSIPFLQRLSRSTVAAILISSFIWGFGHANYPQQPFWIRGVEVGLVGVVAGLVMLRFGIAATLIWHYTTDAVFTAILLLRSGQPYFIVSGTLAAGVMVLPLVLAALAYRRAGGFAPDEGLTNEALPAAAAVPPPAEVPPWPATPPLPHRRLLAGAVLVACLGAFYFIPGQVLLDLGRTRLGREDAVRLADAYLAERGVVPTDYQQVATLRLDVGQLSALYLLQEQGPAAIQRTYGELLPGLSWSVRYFRPLQEREWLVEVDARRGRVSGFSHVLPENAPGPELAREPAMAVARSALAALGIDLAGHAVNESSSERKKARVDHTFVWQRGEPLAGEALLRVRAEVAGDQATRVDRFVKLPESWVRQREESRPEHLLLRMLRIVLLFALSLFTLLVFLRAARRGEVRWRPVLGASAALAVLSVFSQLNAWPTLFAGYDTSVAASVYLTQALAGHLMEILGLFLAYALCLGTVTALFPHALGMFRSEARRRWGRDAFWCSLLALGLAWGAQCVGSWATAALHPWALYSGIAWPAELDSALPALGDAVEALQGAVILATAVGIVVAAGEALLATQAIPVPARALAFLVATLALIPYQARNLGELLLGWGLALLPLALAIVILRWFWRDNAAAYLFAPLVLLLAREGYILVRQPLPWAAANGWVLLGLAAVLLVWLWAQGRSPAASP